MAMRFTAELPLPEDEGVSAQQLRAFVDLLGADSAYAPDANINVQVITDDGGEPALLAEWTV